MAELFVVGAVRNRDFSSQAQRGGWTTRLAWLPSYRARQWADQCEVTVTGNRRGANRVPQTLSAHDCVRVCSLFYDTISVRLCMVIWLVNNHLERISKEAVLASGRTEKNHGKSQDIRCLGWDSKWAPLEYKPQSMIVTPTYTVTTGYLRSRTLRTDTAISSFSVRYLIAFRISFLISNKTIFSLCLNNEAPRHEDVWGSGSIDPTFLTSAQMEVSGQLHAPADLPPKKEPMVPNGLEAGWAPEPVWAL
jgi:hypothetical protein